MANLHAQHDELRKIRATLAPDDPLIADVDADIERTKSAIASHEGGSFFTPQFAPSEELFTKESPNPLVGPREPPPPPRKPKNPKLASASKTEEVYRDPEFVPGDAGLRSGIPVELGGKLVGWDEPSLEEFHRELAQSGAFSDGVVTPEMFDEGSEEYQDWADSKWAEAYDQAKATGTPIARLNYMNSPEWREGAGVAASVTGKGVELAAKTARGGLSAAYGYMEGRTIPGASDVASKGLEYLPGSTGNEFEEQRHLKEQYPVARTVGEIGGALDPRSVGSYLGAKGLGLLGGAAPGFLRRTAASGAVAATEGGVGGGIGEAASQGVQIAEGERSGFDMDRVQKRAEINALLGGGMGVGMSGVGSLAQKGSEIILPPVKRKAAELAGFGFGFGGIKVPKDVESAIAVAEGANVAPQSVLAEGLAPRYVQAGDAFVEEGLPKVAEHRNYPAIRFDLDHGGRDVRTDRIESSLIENISEKEQAKQAYSEMLTAYKDKRANTRPLITALFSRASADRPTVPANASAGDGGDALMQEVGIGNPELIKTLTQMKAWKPTVVPDHELRSALERSHGVVISTEDAAKIGLSVPPGHRAIVNPGELSPRDLVRLDRAIRKNPELSNDPDLIRAMSEVNKDMPGLAGYEERRWESPTATQWFDETRGIPTKSEKFQGQKVSVKRDLVRNEETGEYEEQIIKPPFAYVKNEGKPSTPITFEKYESMMRKLEAQGPETWDEVIDPGMDPVEVKRVLKLAGIPQRGNRPIPWDQMDGQQQLATVKALQRLASGKAENLQSSAADTVANAGNIGGALDRLKGQSAGLELMGRNEDEAIPIGVGRSGAWLKGIPKSALVRMDPILGGLSSIRPRMGGVAAGYSSKDEELKEKAKKEGKGILK